MSSATTPGARPAASVPDRNKPEFNQTTAADYACNGSGQISPRSIRRATDDGELHPVRIGRKWLYSRADIDAWLLARRSD